MPRGLAVVSVVILAFVLIFAMGSLLATQLTQLAGDLPRYQSTISEKIQSFRETTAGRGTLERASGMLKDLSKELEKPKRCGRGHRFNPESQGSGTAYARSGGSTPARSERP
jgi:predicted PurR-regulated permease PerM